MNITIQFGQKLYGHVALLTIIFFPELSRYTLSEGALRLISFSLGITSQMHRKNYGGLYLFLVPL